MSEQSRERIRSRLRQGAQQKDGVVTRVVKRFAALGDAESARPPDHRPSIKADYSMCCSYHEEHSFQAVHLWLA
jgi:hypothetical protein